MKCVTPTHDRQRQTFLADAVTTAGKDKELNRLQLSNQLFGDLKRLQKSFNKGLDGLKDAYRDRRQGIAVRNEAQTVLSGSVRRFMASLYNWIAGENLPINLLDLCKLPTEGARPNPKNGTQWVLVARDLLHGHQQLLDRGYEPFVYPTTNTLATDLTRLETALLDLSEAKANLQEAQENMRVLRETFTYLHRGTGLYIRYKTVTLKAPAQREVMRRYGFVFTPTGRIPREVVEAPVTVDDAVDEGIGSGENVQEDVPRDGLSPDVTTAAAPQTDHWQRALRDSGTSYRQREPLPWARALPACLGD